MAWQRELRRARSSFPRCGTRVPAGRDQPQEVPTQPFPLFLVNSWLHHPPGSLWGFPLLLSLVASRPVDLCWQKRSPNSLSYCLAVLLAAHSARMTKLLSVPKTLPAGAPSAIPHMPKSLSLGVI